MKISDDTDVVSLFTALAQMDMAPLNQNTGRGRRSDSSEGKYLPSALTGMISCAIVFVIFGTILSRKRPNFMRASRSNRCEGNL